jgi:hypothetical protein
LRYGDHVGADRQVALSALKKQNQWEVPDRPDHTDRQTGGHDEQWWEHECVRILPGREPNAEVRPEPLADAPVRGEQGDECHDERAEPTDPDDRSRGRRRNRRSVTSIDV